MRAAISASAFSVDSRELVAHFAARVVDILC